MEKKYFEQHMHVFFFFYNERGDELYEATVDETLRAFQLFCTGDNDGVFDILEEYV